MSATTSPSNTSFSLNSPSMADSVTTEATSRSSTSFVDHSPRFNPGSTSAKSPSNSLPWILHRIFECQLSRELPLRTMFTFNSGQKLPTLRQAYQWWNKGEQGKLIIKFLSSQANITPSSDDTTIRDLKNLKAAPSEAFNLDHHPNDRFMDQGNEALLDVDFLEIDKDRRQSEGLPVFFIQDYCLNKVFTKDYEDAHFDQSLAGLDYIRDLEVTRRTSLWEAAQRLGITRDNWRDVLSIDPDAKAWIENMQILEVDISNYYANIFLNLRIWTMISELKCPHFYKSNVLAMLNTLFPPSVKELPNDKIDKSVLHKHRAHLYRCVLEREKHGSVALDRFVEHLLRPGTNHSWPETRHNLEQYFERAEHTINSATAIHNINFFRDRATKHAPPTPSLSERPITNDSGNTAASSQLSYSHRNSYDSAGFKSPALAFDSYLSRQKLLDGHKIALDDQDYLFDPITTTWDSQQSDLSYNRSAQNSLIESRKASPSVAGQAEPSSLLSGIDGVKFSESSTPNADISSLRSRIRNESRPGTPFIVQASEAAQYAGFTRPITPFADKRQEVIFRREVIQNGSSRNASLEASETRSNTLDMASLEWSRTFPQTPKTGCYYNIHPQRRIRKASSTLEKPSLINDNLEFLKRPYDPPVPPLRSAPAMNALKKVSSISSLFVRKKASAFSICTVCKESNIGNENALGIEIESLGVTESAESFPRISQEAPSRRNILRKQKSCDAINRSTPLIATHSYRCRNVSRVIYPEPMRSTETFARFPQETQTRPHILRKQASSSVLEQSISRNTSHPQAPESVTESILSRVTEDGEQLKRTLKAKTSMPALHTKCFFESGGGRGVDHFFVGTGDEYERYMHVPIPRPAPTLAPDEPKKKEVRTAKSFASMGTWATNDSEKTIRPRKSSLFRHEPQRGDSIRAKTISEPFPMELSHSLTLLDPESRSKEYKRKWFIEQARANRYGLNPPTGDPVKDEITEEKFEPNKLPELVKKILRKEEVAVVGEEFEMPRATPIPFVRPERQRWDTIFPRRAPPRPRKEAVKNYTEIELGKYAKFPGKDGL